MATQKPVQLFDRATNKWVDVDPSDITGKVASGSHGFASGIDIPVVSPEGQLGSIPAASAEEAFRNGFRWQTPQDQEADSARKIEASKEAAYGNRPVTSALMGVAGTMSMGLGPVINNLTGNAENEAETKKRNPISHMAGSVAGAVLPGVGTVGSAIRTGVSGAARAATGLGEAALAEGAAAAAPTLASTAAKIVSNVVPNAIGSAVEGAFYGLGQGVSEAALGKPEEITEHLIGNLENGFLFGGAFGAGFGALSDASPLIKSIAGSTIDKGRDIIKGAAQKATDGVLSPVLRAMGKGEQAEAVGSLVGKEAERAAVGARVGELEEVSALAKSAEKEAAARAKELDGNVRSYIQSLPNEARQEVKAAFESAGGDLNAAREALEKGRDSMRSTYMSQLHNMTDESPKVIGRLYTDAEKIIQELKSSGDAASKRLGETYKNILNSEIKPQYGALKGIERDASLVGNYPIASEVALAQRLVEATEKGLGKLSTEGREAAEQFSKRVNGYALLNHPDEFVSKMQSRLSLQEETLQGFDKLIGNTTNAGSPLLRVFNNPARAEAANTIMDNIGQFYPEFKTIQSKIVSAKDKQAMLEGAIEKVKQLKGDAAGGRLSTADMNEVLSAFKSPAKFKDRLDELRNLESELAAVKDLSPVDKYIRVQKALGHDIKPEIAELAKLEPTYAALEKLKPAAGSEKPLTVGKLTAAGLATYIHPALGAAVGAAESVASMGRNPYRTMQTLTAIERSANKGAKKLQAASDAVINSLTSPGARRAAIAAGASFYNVNRSLEERSEEFKKQADFLKTLQDPAKAMNFLENRLGSWQGAPQLQAQMGAQMLKMASFLVTKLPQDPLKGKTLMGMNTGWSPSDYELSKFNRYVTAAQDPTHVLSNIASGIATHEEIETLQTLYPDMFQKLQSKVLDGITQNGDKLSYQQRLTIGSLFGVPADATLQPDFIKKMQGNHAQEQQQDKGGRPEGKSIKIDLNQDSALATETTRITNK